MQLPVSTSIFRIQFFASRLVRNDDFRNNGRNVVSESVPWIDWVSLAVNRSENRLRLRAGVDLAGLEFPCLCGDLLQG